MQLLVDAFNPQVRYAPPSSPPSGGATPAHYPWPVLTWQTVESIMCRSLVSVRHDGALFDCDFNQALATPLAAPSGNGYSIWGIDSLEELAAAPVITSNHCFGCTAGMGSS